MGFVDFLKVLSAEPVFLFVALLICGVVFVNGWTDAPGAITASVSTGALKMKNAAVLAAVFNFCGALIMGTLNSSVMRSVGEITMLIGNGEGSLAVLCASMLSIILWATLAWYFGIPTSESHALISGVLGGALAVGSEITAHSVDALKLALVGLIFSFPAGCLVGVFYSKLLNLILRNINGQKRERFIKRGQIIGAASMAFMHGAQDSQKFAGVFVAAMCMTSSVPSDIGLNNAPMWLTVLCSLLIALGTSVGGYRIIKKVGMDTVELTEEKGLASDMAGATCMLLASIGGIPVSTTHTSSASIIGAGISDKNGKLNTSSLKDMILAWLFTFPSCGLLSFGLAKLFMMLL